MEAKERQGEDSIVQVYAALMLTMLVAQNPAGRRELHSALPAAGLSQLTEVVERFLSFDEQVGTSESECVGTPSYSTLGC